MSGQSVFFEGSAPENYDRYLGPMFFEPYAIDLIGRLSIGEAGSVLELACGTGIVTRLLRDGLPATATLTATDLSRPMMALAEKKLEAGKPVVWKQADASDLPFAAEEFDAVICQFGLIVRGRQTPGDAGGETCPEAGRFFSLQCLDRSRGQRFRPD